MNKFPPIAAVHTLGDYLREQRHGAELSLRQLSEVAGISNPYLSQIERGLKKPSAEILQALAKALRISAESLYVRAGFLEERTDLGVGAFVDVQAAVLADPRLSNRQRAVLLDVYESFVGEPAPEQPEPEQPEPEHPVAEPEPEQPVAEPEPEQPVAKSEQPEPAVKASTKPTKEKKS